ncbi:hypothetical protein HC026_02185 [Lactobacillus sp. LC28-10]|uniref:Acyl carrier protein n=1 Tax=Secundilactobacillus angelensis TaxID=2722706 RepID=A0ABX1KX77_9LACO|nr:hypothetical protein [Secundilactobacillus angelensis]MCH5461463.1 hypothetical protein [Secundilactobacillus angelensis]NLR17724.1 hypothetical protein [Secundilactobacillus angelensis]
MLTAQQLRAVIQQNMPFKRAQSILQNDWQNIDDQNPLARQLMTIEDLQFALALQNCQSETQFTDTRDYASVMSFVNQHQDDLAPGSRDFLLRGFK